MLSKIHLSLFETASLRALSSLINIVSLEITTRRDTSVTVSDKNLLKVLHRVYDALNYSWSKMEVHCAPEVYASNWDSYLDNSSKFIKLILKFRVKKMQLNIVADFDLILLESAFANSKKFEATERVIEFMKV